MTVSPDRFRSQRRHRLCPECGFDLAGSLDAGVDQCPECGIEFSYHDLVREVRPGDWTQASAFYRFCAGLLCRGTVLFLIWLGALLAMFSALDGPGFLLVLTALALGTASGWFLFSDLEERAGFDSPLLVPLAGVILALAFGGGIAVASTWSPMPAIVAVMALVGGVGTAVYAIVSRSLRD